MADQEVTYNWNGQAIRFNAWHGDAVGVYDYTTRDGRYQFQFDLRRIGSEVRVYILSQPSYGRRATDGHSTHRLHDSGGNYICIRSDLTPDNVPDALSWLVYWAEETGQYISTGRGFS